MNFSNNLEELEKKILLNVFEFNDTTVETAMTSRENVVVLDIHDSKEKVMDTIKKTKYTRFPIMENGKIIGVLNVNHQPVSENIHFNLAKPFTVKSEKQGTAKIALSMMGIPIKTIEATVIPRTEVVAGGMAVGVSMDTRGIMVLGTGYVNGEENKIYEPAKGILQSGDMILQADGKSLKNKEDLRKAVEENGEKTMPFLVDRNGVQQTVEITPVFSKEDNSCKIGIWVRDSTQGIGTITFFNPDRNTFAALGHGVYDVDTQELMQIKNGQIKRIVVGYSEKGKEGKGERKGREKRQMEVLERKGNG